MVYLQDPTTTETATYLQEVYDLETLKEIALHGCESGLATHHTYYHQTNEFFNKFQDNLEDYYWHLMGTDYLSYFAKDQTSVQAMINSLVWNFIQRLSIEITEEV